MTVRVKVVRGTGAGIEFQIPPEGTITFGRSAPANVRVHDARCSRKHCQLRHQDGRLRVIDLESRNGTFVNGRRIQSETILESGDKLRLGGCEMLFTESAKDAPPPPKPHPETAEEEDLPLIIPIVEEGPLFCPVCSREVEPHAASCPGCEAQFGDPETAADLPTADGSEALYCPTCGNQVEAEATQCRECETEFSAP